MPLDSNIAYAKRTAVPAQPRPGGIIRLRANLGESIVTVIATAIAVLIVASIAVLMGMA
jgi:hypothetical protein